MSFQTTYGPDGRLRVAILGCTGSIGTQALDVCRQHADRLQVTALSVNSSTSELVAAAREFSVRRLPWPMSIMAMTPCCRSCPRERSSALARRRFASSRVATMSTACLSLLWAPPVSRRAMRP